MMGMASQNVDDKRTIKKGVMVDNQRTYFILWIYILSIAQEREPSSKWIFQEFAVMENIMIAK